MNFLSICLICFVCSGNGRQIKINKWKSRWRSKSLFFLQSTKQFTSSTNQIKLFWFEWSWWVIAVDEKKRELRSGSKPAQIKLIKSNQSINKINCWVWLMGAWFGGCCGGCCAHSLHSQINILFVHSAMARSPTSLHCSFHFIQIKLKFYFHFVSFSIRLEPQSPSNSINLFISFLILKEKWMKIDEFDWAAA